MLLKRYPVILSKNNKPPKVQGLPILGNLFDYIRDPLKFHQRMEDKYENIARFSIANIEIYYTFNPEDIKHILVDNAQNYNKSSAYKHLRGVLGSGVLTVDQKDWGKRRRIATPSFTKPMLDSYSAEMCKIIQESAIKLNKQYAINEEFSLFQEMNSIALQNAGVTMFGAKLKDHGKALSDNLSLIMLLLEKKISSITLPPWIPTPFNKKFHKTKAFLRDEIESIVNDARKKYESGEKIPSLIQSLIEVDKNAKDINDWGILDEALTYLVAGHETTGSALTWAFYLISKDPVVEHKLSEEIRKVLQGKPVTANDISKLVYTRQVAQETLRLYPSVWTFGRSNIKEDVLSGYKIPPNTDIGIAPYLMHRNPKYWNEPNKFDPERFSPENEKLISKYHYFPFAAGPRNCIGHTFAMNEMILVLATFTQFFQFRIKKGFVPVPEILVAMRPGGGMPMVIRKKHKTGT
jgi:cytochrome P450